MLCFKGFYEDLRNMSVGKIVVIGNNWWEFVDWNFLEFIGESRFLKVKLLNYSYLWKIIMKFEIFSFWVSLCSINVVRGGFIGIYF